MCFSMLKAALCGNYVNFGVFHLYGDTALDNVLGMFVKLLLSIPQSDLLVCLVALEVIVLSAKPYTFKISVTVVACLLLSCVHSQIPWGIPSWV